MLILVGILLGVALAFFYPESILWMREGLRPAFAVTMFFVGSLVHPDEIRSFLKAPQRALSGLLCQYTIMPLCAFAVSLLFEDPVLRTGIILVGCMPGAMASNVMTALLKGDLVLSVTMTTVATFLSPLVLAFWLPLLADTRMELPVGDMVWNTTWMVAGPVVLGAGLRSLRPDVPACWNRLATGVASLAIILIVLVVVAANRHHLMALGPAVVAAIVSLNLTAYALAFGAAKAMGWPDRQRRTLVIEVGMQNAGLGSVLALHHLGEAGAVPSAFYTVLCVITAAMALPLQTLLRNSPGEASEEKI